MFFTAGIIPTFLDMSLTKTAVNCFVGAWGFINSSRV